LATPFNSNIPIAPGSQIRTVLNAFEQNTWENARLHNMDGKVAAILHKLRPSNKPLRYFRSDPERGFLEYMLSTASKSTQREQVTTRAVGIGGIILCTFEVADATLRQTFSSDICQTPTMFAKVLDLAIAGLWVESDSWNCKDMTRFFFWCPREMIQASGWIANLYCVELGELQGLRNLIVEEREACTRKMKQASAFFGGVTEAEREDSVLLHTSDLVSYQLYDESEEDITIRVEYADDSFGSALVASTTTCKIWHPSKGADKEHILNIELQVQCRMANGKARIVVVKTEGLKFAAPVAAQGWKYDPTHGRLKILKSAHNFFSTLRRVDSQGCFCQVSAEDENSGWKNSHLRYLSGVQMTREDIRYRAMKNASPDEFRMNHLLYELKDSMKLLLQIKDNLIHIKLDENGIGIVCVVIRHGILMDRQSMVPVLDLSVCYVSQEISLEIATTSMQMLESHGDTKMPCLTMRPEVYQLFQNLCNYRRATMAPALRQDHPKLSDLVRRKELRPFFKRVLLRPLFPSVGEQEAVFEEALGRKSLMDPLARMFR